MLVASNAAEDDIILLSSLERINAGDFDLLVQIFLQRPVELHIIDDVRPLALIWSDDADLAWYDTRLKEFRHDFLHIGSLSPTKSCQLPPGFYRRVVPIEE